MQPVQVLVLGDSIIQRLVNWRQTSRNQEYIVDIMCYRGCTISRLASKIERNRVNISGYDKILVHIGTNDIMCNSKKKKKKKKKMVEVFCKQDFGAKIYRSQNLDPIT